MFESIFTSTTTENAFDIGASLLGIITAVALGLLIGLVYMWACKKDGYSKNFMVGLVLLPAIVAVVILLVGSNIARAFSMAGAFALVRFRSAPGSAKDIAIVFFAMAAGLACGLGFVTFAIAFVIIILLTLVVLSLTGFGGKNEGMKQLRITIPENLNYTQIFDDIFATYMDQKELRMVKTTNMGTMFELYYYVKMKDSSKEKELMDAIRTKNGNLNITMGMIDQSSSLLN